MASAATRTAALKRIALLTDAQAAAIKDELGTIDHVVALDPITLVQALNDSETVFSKATITFIVKVVAYVQGSGRLTASTNIRTVNDGLPADFVMPPIHPTNAAPQPQNANANDDGNTDEAQTLVPKTTMHYERLSVQPLPEFSGNRNDWFGWKTTALDQLHRTRYGIAIKGASHPEFTSELDEQFYRFLLALTRNGSAHWIVANDSESGHKSFADLIKHYDSTTQKKRTIALTETKLSQLVYDGTEDIDNHISAFHRLLSKLKECGKVLDDDEKKAKFLATIRARDYVDTVTTLEHSDKSFNDILHHLHNHEVKLSEVDSTSEHIQVNRKVNQKRSPNTKHAGKRKHHNSASSSASAKAGESQYEYPKLPNWFYQYLTPEHKSIFSHIRNYYMKHGKHPKEWEVKAQAKEAMKKAKKLRRMSMNDVKDDEDNEKSE